MPVFDGEDGAGFFDSEAGELAQLGPPPAALAFPVVGATAFFQEGRFVSQSLTGIAGWWPVEGMATQQPLIAAGNIPKSNRNAPLFFRDISRVTSTQVTPLLANETISQWLGTAVDFHLVAVVDVDTCIVETSGMFYRSGVFSSPGGNIGLELYRTGSPGAWQFWAAFYITSGEALDASAFDGWKVAVTEVFGLIAEGRGRVVLQAKAESGNLYVRSGTDAWGTGVPIANTWVPGIADYPHVGRNYGTNYELDGTIRALGFYDSAQPDIGWSDDIAAWAAATFPADSHLTGEWDASYDVFGYYEGYGFWPGKVGPLVPIRRDAVGITASNSPANQAVNGYTAPRFDAVNDYLQAPHVLGAFFAENGREGTAVIALLPRNPVAASLGVPTANTPYANPGPLADTQGYVLLAWADDAGTPKAIAGAYDGQTRDPVAGGLVDVGNGLNDGWQMVTSPASASVEHMLTMRWSAERGLLELAVDNGAFVTYPFLSVLALNGYLLFGTNYAIGTHLDADIGAVRLFRCAITDAERDAVGAELQAVTGWSFGFAGPSFDGTGALDLSPLVITATGEVRISGIASLSLSALSLAATGAQARTGTGSLALKSLSHTATGTKTHSGSGSLAVSPLSAAGTGAKIHSGSGSLALSSLSCSAAGAKIHSGTGSCALSPLSSSGTGAKIHSGSGSLACSPLSSSATGLKTHSGSGALALSPLSAAGTAALVVNITGSGSCALSPLSASATGAEVFSGSGSLACSPLSVSCVGAESFSGSASCALQPLSLASSGVNTPPPRTGTCALDLSPLACSATGAESFTGSASLAVSPLACSGSGALAFTGAASLALSPLLSAGAGTSILHITGSGSLALMPLNLVVSGGQGVFFTGSGSLALAPLSAAATGSLRFAGTGSLALSPLLGTAAGNEAFAGSGVLSLAPLSAAATGTFLPLVTGTGSLSLQALSALGEGSESFEGDASLTLASLVAAATGDEVFDGAVLLELAPLAVFADGSTVGMPIDGTATLDLSPLSARGEGETGAVFGVGFLTLGRFDVVATGMLILVPPPARPGQARLVVPVRATARVVLGERALATVVAAAKGVVKQGTAPGSGRAVLVPSRRARTRSS